MKRVVVAAYRVRGIVYYVAAVVLIGNLLIGRLLPADGVRQVRGVLVVAAILAVALCLLLIMVGPRLLPVHVPRSVLAPVRGRWLALNSPASSVPSHGVRMYGQAYAIDVVADPPDGSRPAFGSRMMRPAAQYPAFGQPVFAMIDGTVVRASSWRRDHRARSNTLGFVYLMIEGIVREIGGPGFIIGNHVTIRGDDGVYATVAHLRRGSVTVKPGERVLAGQLIGECGNSGNSTEPHVHAQLMDRASLWTAQGLPMVFEGIEIAAEQALVDDLPENGQHLVAVDR